MDPTQLFQIIFILSTKRFQFQQNKRILNLLTMIYEFLLICNSLTRYLADMPNSLLLQIEFRERERERYLEYDSQARTGNNFCGY